MRRPGSRPGKREAPTVKEEDADEGLASEIGILRRGRPTVRDPLVPAQPLRGRSRNQDAIARPGSVEEAVPDVAERVRLELDGPGRCAWSHAGPAFETVTRTPTGTGVADEEKQPSGKGERSKHECSVADPPPPCAPARLLDQRLQIRRGSRCGWTWRSYDRHLMKLVWLASCFASRSIAASR